MSDWAKEPEEDETGYNGLCNGRVKGGSGRRCKKIAGWQTDHEGIGPCKLHGGTLPSVAMSARLRAAGQLVRKLGVPREQITDPRDSLIEMHQLQLGKVDLYRAIVSCIEVDEIAGPQLTIKEGEKPFGKDSVVEEYWETVEGVGVNVWVRLFDEAMDRLVEIASGIVKLGLLERHIEIEAAQASMLGQALMQTLDELGFTAEMRTEAVRMMTVRLRAIEAEAQRTPPGIGRGNPHR